jgi:hypothetical protein
MMSDVVSRLLGRCHGSSEACGQVPAPWGDDCLSDLAFARRQAQLWAAFEAVGQRIGAHVRMIAASTLRCGGRN